MYVQLTCNLKHKLIGLISIPYIMISYVLVCAFNNFSFPVQAGKEKILRPQGKITRTSRKVYDHHS